MYLAPNFPLSEFEFSQTALLHGIDNRLPGEYFAAAQGICQMVLQPLRDALLRPLSISSGYRSQALDKHLKKKRGAWVSKSQHCRGEAADLLPPGGTDNVGLAKLVLAIGLDFDQMIVEKPGAGWLHISYRLDGTNRREVRSWLGGNNYPMGIVES